jgi:hypothetical protein
MISHQYKCIFVHIPKCGGTSIENVIWPEPRKTEDLWMGFTRPFYNKYQTGGLQHLFAIHIREEFGEKIFNEYFKFTIVRNPWDKAVSQYFYMRHRPDLRKFLGMEENASFPHYLRLITKINHVQWDPQHKFITDDTGTILVDYTGRLENMAQDTRAIFDRIGIRQEIEHVNATSHRHYSHYYDDESMSRVGEMYARDIELFNYSFEREDS